MDKESKGILDNPIINYLPSKFEDLIIKGLFKPGVRETRDWFKSRMNHADFLGEKRYLLPKQITKWLGLSASKAGRQKILGSKLDSDLMRLRDVKGGGEEFMDYVYDVRDKPEIINLMDVIKNVIGASHFADLDKGKYGMNMSYSRMLGHALQGGGLTAAALTLPYVGKRHRQHMKMNKDEKKEDKLKKKSSIKKDAGLFEQLGDSFKANRPGDLIKGPYSPWKRSPLALPLAVLAAMGAYKGTKHGILKLTDMESDRRMNKRDEELRRELSRLMVADNVSKEASVKEASDAKDKHGNVLSNVAWPVLLALWAGMIPPFYSFGKKLGKDTSENAQYDKLLNAISSFEKNAPRSTRFQAGDEDSTLEQRPGSFLGSRTVVLPVANRNRASAALNEIF